MSLQERRRFVRMPTRTPLTYIVLPSGSAQLSVTKDLSSNGARLTTEQLLPAGIPLQIALQLPDEAQPVHFTAEVVWSEPYEVEVKAERQRMIETGVRFAEIAPRDRERVSRHLRRTLGTEGASAE